METQELYRLINLQPEIIQKLNEIFLKMKWECVNPYLERLMYIKTADKAYQDLNAFFPEDQEHLIMLCCQLECARRVFDQYQEKRITKSVYVDTMECFPRFIEECEKKNGRKFFDRGWWTYRQLSMNIFRLGELEYQFKEYRGENAIGIHIPSDADLSKAAVDASLELAETFFQTYYPDFPYSKYVCRSWLMAPVLKQMLSEQSHIIAFQERFCVMEEDSEDRDYVEWLFQVPADTDCKNLPTVTSLQRNVKAMLLNGGAVGSALGIMQKNPERGVHVGM